MVPRTPGRSRLLHETTYPQLTWEYVLFDCDNDDKGKVEKRKGVCGDLLSVDEERIQVGTHGPNSGCSFFGAGVRSRVRSVGKEDLRKG